MSRASAGMADGKIANELLAIREFLAVETPSAWLESVHGNLDLLLIDHANCEKKAASTALSLLYKYIDRGELLDKLSRLAREELRHFEQVLSIMKARDVPYRHVSASRYAAALIADVRPAEPGRLVDTLIVGAFIEARSCERFAALIPCIEELDPSLAEFYFSLLRSEARHYQDYLRLAERYADEELENGTFAQRIEHFRQREADLIRSDDTEFRFHSGVAVA